MDNSQRSPNEKVANPNQEGHPDYQDTKPSMKPESHQNADEKDKQGGKKSGAKAG